MAAPTHPALSPAEFVAVMDRAAWKAPIELIDAEVVVIPPSGGDASLAQTEIVHRLRAWQTRRDMGGRVLTDVFVRVGSGYLAPDAAWWSPGNEPKIQPGAIDRVPDLVIEVLSPATRENDLGVKRDHYLSGGVQELWLIDPGNQTALVVDLQGERHLGRNDTLGSRLLPGFTLTVADLFV